MKRIILVAMAAAALLACSKEQVIEKNRANDEITFSVVADNQTKAAAVYCANNLMTSFTVASTYTPTDGAASWYFKDDVITKSGETWANQSATRYWADGGTLDFYAIVNGTMTLGEATAAPKVENFDPSTTVGEQLDLLYAVATDKTKSDNSASGVALNFRHALSQIEFMARNTNANLHVVIEGVQVGQTPSIGTFTYPTTATDQNYVNHNQNTTADPALNTGTWSVSGAADYQASFDPVEVAGNNTAVGLTLSTDTNSETRDFANSMLLLPTSFIENTVDGAKVYGTTAWTPATSANAFNGTYLAVNCKIYNVAGDKYDESDICLHTGWAVIPVAFNWQPGKKYIYTFVFGEGNGGYEGGDPDPDDPDNPTPGDDPVLAPITYTVTVDDFQLGDNIDVEMEY